MITLTAVLPSFVACTSTLLLSMALWRTPVVALMPTSPPRRSARKPTESSTLWAAWARSSPSSEAQRFYDMNPAFPFWLGSILVILSAALVLIFIREPKNFEEGVKQPGMFASLKEVTADQDKSALRILLAIFFWFLGYTAIEAFFTLYSVNHLGLEPSDGSRLLGQLFLFFVLFALVSGFIGGKIGRKLTISIGLVMMIVVLLGIFVLPVYPP